MTYHAQVDKDACMSSGKCVADAPSVFAFDDDEIAEAVGPSAQLSDEMLLDIARNCPASAIRLLDTAGQPVLID